ncbi:hypothetical protein [Streptomyces mirabilis]|uniref:hypothetical protein n=1 Tax=Streptomyces mirabilis TaxID=68239 RepID=UPI003322778C
MGTVDGEQVAVVDMLVFSEQQLRDAHGDGETGRLGGGPEQGAHRGGGRPAEAYGRSRVV